MGLQDLVSISIEAPIRVDVERTAWRLLGDFILGPLAGRWINRGVNEAAFAAILSECTAELNRIRQHTGARLDGWELHIWEPDRCLHPPPFQPPGQIVIIAVDHTGMGHSIDRLARGLDR